MDDKKQKRKKYDIIRITSLIEKEKRKKEISSNTYK